MEKNIEQMTHEEIEPRKTLAELEKELNLTREAFYRAIELGNTPSAINVLDKAYKMAVDKYEEVRHPRLISEGNSYQRFLRAFPEKIALYLVRGKN